MKCTEPELWQIDFPTDLTNRELWEEFVDHVNYCEFHQQKLRQHPRSAEVLEFVAEHRDRFRSFREKYKVPTDICIRATGCSVGLLDCTILPAFTEFKIHSDHKRISFYVPKYSLGLDQDLFLAGCQIVPPGMKIHSAFYEVAILEHYCLGIHLQKVANRQQFALQVTCEINDPLTLPV